MPEIIKFQGLEFQKFIEKKQISVRVKELGKVIFKKYKNKKPIFISILSGSFVFAADLIRTFKTDAEVNFVKLQSYHGLGSSGKIDVLLDLPENLGGRHLIVIEDIVDSGRTLDFLLKKLKEKSPASVSVAAFLVKPAALEFEVKIDHIGFEISNEFVIGYGLDFDGLGRNLPDIYQKIG
jgi:hypoxanthine phosphoribosyltransferase